MIEIHPNKALKTLIKQAVIINITAYFLSLN